MTSLPSSSIGADIASLVEPDRVHRRLYADPEIFELEMRLLFGRAWLLLGHESQVKAPGDYFLTRMAREPVIVTRHTDGSVQVLFNRCAHRGAAVCHLEKGHAQNFVCPYHGWSFATDGALRYVPIAEGYGQELEKNKAQLGLAKVARVDSYRGFIFASLAKDGPSLLDFLGYMKTSFDDFVDRAPGGEVEVAGGVFKHAYNGNWKLMLENHNDTVHPAFVHASSVHTARDQAIDSGAHVSDIAVRQMRQNGAPVEVWEKLDLWTTEMGHSFMGDYHTDDRLVASLDNPVFREYFDALTARLGESRAREVLSVSRFNSILYPNCSFMSQFRQLRIVHPLAVDRTVVYTYSYKLKGAPEQLFRDTVAFANIVNGTASAVLTDDLEVYERTQRSLSGGLADWVYLGRGYGGDIDNIEGTRRGATGTSEIHIRNQFAAWKQYMTGSAV